MPPNFFPEWFGPKQIEAIRFQNGFHEKSAQTDCSKELWIPILKGLKHLNAVVNYDKQRFPTKQHKLNFT